MQGLFTFVDVPMACTARTGGMAEAPDALREVGLAEALTGVGGVDGGEAMPPTVTTQDQAAFQAATERIAHVIDAKPRPLLLLGGDCTIICGTMAAAQDERPLLIWIDAHGDFNTVKTTPSNYWPGMPLAQVAGLPTPLGPNRLVIPGQDIVLIAVRDLDPGEDKNALSIGAHIFERTLPPVEELPMHTPGCPAWVHLDLDVFDPSEIAALNFPVPGGLHMDDMVTWLGQVSRRFKIIGIEVTAFDPRRDKDGQVARRLVRFLTDMARAVWTADNVIGDA